MQLKSILGLCTAAALMSAPLVHAAGDPYGAGAAGSAQQGAMDQPGAQQQAEQRSDAVLQVQQALNSEGFSAGPEDGILGPRTRSALGDFQQAAGIQASGELDRDTINALGLDPESSEFAAFVEEGDAGLDAPDAGAMPDGSGGTMRDDGTMRDGSGTMQDGAGGGDPMSRPGM